MLLPLPRQHVPSGIQGKLIADYEGELKARDLLQRRFARQLEAARETILEKIDKLALAEDNEEVEAAA